MAIDVEVHKGDVKIIEPLYNGVLLIIYQYDEVLPNIGPDLQVLSIYNWWLLELFYTLFASISCSTLWHVTCICIPSLFSWNHTLDVTLVLWNKNNYMTENVHFLCFRPYYDKFIYLF